MGLNLKENRGSAETGQRKRAQAGHIRWELMVDGIILNGPISQYITRENGRNNGNGRDRWIYRRTYSGHSDIRFCECGAESFGERAVDEGRMRQLDVGVGSQWE